MPDADGVRQQAALSLRRLWPKLEAHFAAQRADAVRENARLVTLNPAFGAHCALLVDRLAGLRSVGQLRAEVVEDAPRPDFATALWCDAEGRRWQEIDLEALARHEQFLGIAA